MERVSIWFETLAQGRCFEWSMQLRMKKQSSGFPVTFRQLRAQRSGHSAYR
jgi:hypothetical protein